MGPYRASIVWDAQVVSDWVCIAISACEQVLSAQASQVGIHSPFRMGQAGAPHSS